MLYRSVMPSYRNVIAVLLFASVAVAPSGPSAIAAQPAEIAGTDGRWTLRNDVLEATVAFADDNLRLDSLVCRETKVECIAGKTALSTHVVDGVNRTGGWKLVDSDVRDIELFGKTWGKRLEVTLTRPELTVRHVFELYDGRAGIRYLSRLKNNTDKEVTIHSSEVLNLKLRESARTLHYVEGVATWKHNREALTRGGRNCIVRYDGGYGVFVSPENNWATCLEPGEAKALASEKLMYVSAFADADAALRVTTNPRAVQLTLFPQEEVEYFSVDFGVFAGDALDGRVAAAEHFRKRYRFVGPMHQLATNDWQWQDQGRTDKMYRETVIPNAAAAGFDRINIDDYWYWPEDSCEPKDNWTDMASLCDAIVKAGMKPGHWFSLQGKWCINGWGKGRDCADPANVEFKLQQMNEILIGKYQSRWDQVDAGLLWKTDQPTPFSHPMDSVYRKILGMKRYMNTVAAAHPDFLMQVTCEIDNPAGPGQQAGSGNQNVGLIHLADNGIIGMFRRTETHDNVRDLFGCVGMLPLEGLLSTWGEDGIRASSWQDSPLWYYQFLLARHTMTYSRPWEWSPESIAHLRAFNDWRKSPPVAALLNEVMRPVYNGADWEKNDGPWAWMFTDEKREKAILITLNHLDLAPSNAFTAKLRWLDPKKNYRVTDITMQPGGKFNHKYIGVLTGEKLSSEGLSVNLDAGPERCAAYWFEATSD